MLRQFGARIESRGLTTTLTPGPLSAAPVVVPGDISSAAFPLIAAAIVKDARVTVAGVGLNPTRTGALDVLAAMGVKIEIAPYGGEVLEGSRGPSHGAAGEPRGDVTVSTSSVRGTGIGGALIPRLVDEIPVLAVAAALADGRTDITDAAELRVKESDRLAALARELGRMGARGSGEEHGVHGARSAPGLSPDRHRRHVPRARVERGSGGFACGGQPGAAPAPGRRRGHARR